MKRLSIFTLILFGLSFSIAPTTPLELGIGARPCGMGSAFVAISDDANSPYWNPAGLGFLKARQATFMHWMMSEVKGVMVDYFGAVAPLARSSYPYGVGFTWLGKRASLEEEEDNVKSTITENAFSLSYGIRLLTRTAVGFSLNRLSITAKRGEGSGFGIDVGLLLKPLENKGLTVGFLARNLSADIKNENFPSSYRMGFGYRFLGEKAVLAMDLTTKKGVNNKKGMSLDFFSGAEYQVIPQLALRLGWNTRDALSFGLGIEVKKVKFDYAFNTGDKKVFGSAHRFALGYSF
ncbi:MAG: PorV/PorQ family protein [Candidatus Edwardsbacteria bacterium]